MKHLTLLLAAALPTLGFAQVGVGTSSPDASAMGIWLKWKAWKWLKR
jgi:hypothetical protein